MSTRHKKRIHFVFHIYFIVLVVECTCVTAAGNANGTDEGFPRNSGGVRNSEYSTGSARPSLVVNRILFIWAGWAYCTNKVEVLVPAYSLHYGSAQWYTLL